MTTDQVVSAQDVLRSVLRIRREGNQAVLQLLEQQEPDLTEYLLEELTELQRQILDLAGKPAKARRLARQTETIALVLIFSLRQAQFRLWESQTGEALAERLDEPQNGPDVTKPDTDPPPLAPSQ